MILTHRLSLIMPQVSDKVQDTIDWLAQNFQALDDSYDEIISDLDSNLNIGTAYQVGKKYWNKSVHLGGFVGWVNTRTGVFAPTWKSQKTYKAGDAVTAVDDNGHYFECVVGGTSCVNHPALSTVSGDTTYDINGHSKWTESYVYSLNDVVIASDGNMSYYYKCIIEGTSSTKEPVWNNVEGTTIIDGSVHWYVYKTVQWKEKGVSCNFIPFGNIGIDAKTNGYTAKFVQSIGDGTSTSIAVTHNLGTQDVLVMIREADSPYSKVDADIRVSDNNSILINFAVAPTKNQYRVVIVG
ncbi:hypothetical protein ABE137_12725 [Brevibacillus laterosporus]|uniref:head decoration n=1 Tax=Brevibacillus phage Sundance TaxID=1691958 RepID=UPI0006BC44B7|nr:head decoration [Brevibacillus phage Sundance]ALA47853.1 putative head decoration protein [Brevibacillus phage Sundance]